MARIELIARGVAFRRSGAHEILLCAPADGSYAYLPGGHVEFGEDAPTALRREMREETGLDVTIGPLLGVWEAAFVQRGKRRHEINLLFHMEHPWPAEVPSLEPGIMFFWNDFTSVETKARIYPQWLPARLDDFRAGRVFHATDGFPAPSA